MNQAGGCGQEKNQLCLWDEVQHRVVCFEEICRSASAGGPQVCSHSHLKFPLGFWDVYKYIHVRTYMIFMYTIVYMRTHHTHIYIYIYIYKRGIYQNKKLKHLGVRGTKPCGRAKKINNLISKKLYSIQIHIYIYILYYVYYIT